MYRILCIAMKMKWIDMKTNIRLRNATLQNVKYFKYGPGHKFQSIEPSVVSITADIMPCFNADP